MPWTEEAATTASKLWSDGYSAGQIAKELGGGLSRNSVIGKLHRMGLTQATPTDPSAVAAERRQANAESCRRARAKRTAEQKPAPNKPFKPAPVVFGAASPVPKPPAPLKMDDAPGPRSAILLKVGGGCLYPVGEARGADQLFCGEVREPGRSYCPGHVKVCCSGQPTRRAA